VVYCERRVVEGSCGVGVAEASNDVVDGDDANVCVRLYPDGEHSRCNETNDVSITAALGTTEKRKVVALPMHISMMIMLRYL
jgi:hypothetical protein